MSTALVSIPLRDMTITATADQMIPLKPVCETLGIDAEGQRQRLSRTPWATTCVMQAVAEDGKTREMYCLDRKTFTMWLATVDASRVKDPTARDRIGIFQMEAADALDRYFHDGSAIRTPQTMQEALRAYADALDAKAEAEALAATRARELEAAAPKVLFADAVSTSDTCILVGDLAKILRGNGIDIGANSLFAILRRDGYLISREGTDWNMPTQRSMDLGLFRVKETAVTHADGHTTVSKTPKVTGKGQAYFIPRFLDGRLKATSSH